MNIRKQILFEDSNILILNKPAGLLSIPDRFNKEIPSLSNLLERKFGKIYTVHRLDRDTSGIILFAKNEEAHRFYSLAFQNRAVKKFYLALAVGRIWEEKGEINAAIAPDSGKGGKMKLSPKGKEARTTFEVIGSYGLYTYLKLRLHTGRTHQIRIHLKSIGHPVAMDALYGSGEPFYLSSIKRKYHLGKFEEEKPLMDRQALHASELYFKDQNGEEQHFEAPLPKDFSAMLHQLQKNLNN